MQIHEITLREASAFGQMAQQLTTPTQPAGPSQSSTKGTITPTATGLTHTASLDNPNPRTTPPSQQQLWDREYRRLRNQYPGLTDQQYQAAMVKRMGTARPGGAATVATQQPVAPAPTPTVATPLKQFPPITLGTGPKAQVFINKGRGYVDNKTGKPMPPAIVKAMGL